jgi:hypothetical protein
LQQPPPAEQIEALGHTVPQGVSTGEPFANAPNTDISFSVSEDPHFTHGKVPFSDCGTSSSKTFPH